jgi:hypothetical protein
MCRELDSKEVIDMQVKVFDGDTLIKEFSFNGSVDDLAARLEAVPVTLDAVDEYGTPIKVEVFVHPQWANSITSITITSLFFAKEEEDKDEDEEQSILEDIRFPEHDPFGLFPEDDPLSQPLDLLESPSREMEEDKDEDEDEDDEDIFDESEGEDEDTFADEEDEGESYYEDREFGFFDLDMLNMVVALAASALKEAGDEEDEPLDRLLDPLSSEMEEEEEEEEEE